MKTMSMNLLNSVLILLTISSYGETFFVPRAHNINFHKPFDLKRMLAKKKGNTAGATIVLENLCVGIGETTLIDDLSWKIMPNERWAIIGENGCGKSSLLKAITGRDPELIEGGRVHIMPNIRLGYLEQTAVSGATTSVKEEVMSRMVEYPAYVSLNLAQENFNNGVADGLTQLEKAKVEFERVGGYKVEAKVHRVLSGLGFEEKHYNLTCDLFSGGWQMRIALARLLLSNPSILVLDEPSNHLDANAKVWLQKYISQYKGTVLLVSHDLGLLKHSVNSIAEVFSGKVEFYKTMTHAKYLEERKSRIERAQTLQLSNKRKIDQMQDFVSRMGAKASKASQAKDRMGKIKKLEQEVRENAIIDPFKTKSPVLHFHLPPGCGEYPLRLINATVGYEKNSLARALLRNVDFRLSRNMRAVIRGPNGSGKSTLLKALAGSLPLLHGDRVEDDRLALGVFSQDLAQELPLDTTAVKYVMDQVSDYVSEITQNEARSTMGALGLSGDKALRHIGALSGGEKARVALATFCLRPCNVLLLDEPTNHISRACMESLVKALNNYKGVVLVVSHDRSFCDALSINHVISVNGDSVNVEQRSLVDSDWLVS